LKGVNFLGNWGTADGLYKYFSVAMPPTAPGKLGQDVYTEILAYILRENDLPAGDKELAQDRAARASINLSAASTPTADARPSASAQAANPMSGPGRTPQAFTWNKPLPTLQASGEIVLDVSTPKSKSGEAVHQAFTWGKKLPGM
jgi:S-disulfanyl-L-cysteine oxidoreductase SoxD